MKNLSKKHKIIIGAILVAILVIGGITTAFVLGNQNPSVVKVEEPVADEPVIEEVQESAQEPTVIFVNENQTYTAFAETAVPLTDVLGRAVYQLRKTSMGHV